MRVVFELFKGFAWMVSRLPFPLIYSFSALLRILLQHVIRYRRAIIYRNLSRSFPEKTQSEIRIIAGQYYRNLADVILEVIKLQRISGDSLKKRFGFSGLEHIENALNEDRSVIVSTGHCGNWEWMGTALGLILPAKGYAVVKPLADKYFHKYLESLRHRLNPDSTIMFQHTYRTMIRHKKEQRTFNVLAADQTPTREEINYWDTFLHQDTPFFMGVEKLAKSLEFTVVFIDIQRRGRGKYHGEIQLITHDPKNTAEHEITQKYIRLLEDAIIRRPDNWLWSHRRWKHSRMTPGL